MSIREIQPGVWDVQVYGRKRDDGTRERKTKRVHGGRRDAERVETDLKSKRDRKRPIGATPPLSAYSREWLEDKRRRVEPVTLVNYRRAVETHIIPRLGKLKLAEVDPRDVRRLDRSMADAGLSGTTRRYVFRILSMIMRQAEFDRLIDHSPCGAVKPPAEDRREPEALTPDEVRELLACLKGGPLYLPALVAYDTGVRRGELLALKWEDVDLDRGAIEIRHAVEQVGRSIRLKDPKSKRSRRAVKLSPPAVAALRAHKGALQTMRIRYANTWRDEGLVFPCLYYQSPAKPMGRVWTPYAFSKAWRVSMDDVNGRRLGEHVLAGGKVETFTPWEFGLHRLRHTHATHLLLGGIRDEVVSRALGHSSSSVTRAVYSHVLEGEQAETARITGEVIGGG